MNAEILFYKALVGLLVAGIGGVLLYPFKKVKTEWAKLHEKLDKAQSELVLQRENHLTHIQQANETQVKVLEKMATTMEGVRLDLKEQTGYIKALSSLSRPSSRSRSAKQ